MAYIDIPQIRAMAEQIRAMLGDDFDAETFLDTLDGETDAVDLLNGLIKDREEAIASAAASKDLAATYTARAKRMTTRADALKDAMGQVLDAIGERKVACPLGTVSKIKGRASLSIVDEAAIPSQLTRTTVAPDKAAIKASLEAGEAVPGAELVMGADSVRVGVK